MVKPIKAPPFNLQRVLLTSSPNTVAAVLVKRWGQEEAIDALDELLFGDEPWKGFLVPGRAAEALMVLGAEDLVLEELMERVGEDLDELADLTDAEERAWAVMNALALAIGERGSPLAVDELLTFLDAGLVARGEPAHGWRTIVDILASCGERGLRDERTWTWLERLRSSDLEFWCSLAGVYHDERAIPLLHAVIDGIDQTLLDDGSDESDESDSNDNSDGTMERRRAAIRTVIDGVDSLEVLNAARAADKALLGRVRGWTSPKG